MVSPRGAPIGALEPQAGLAKRFSKDHLGVERTPSGLVSGRVGHVQVFGRRRRQRLSARSGGRRPKRARARSRGKPGQRLGVVLGDSITDGKNSTTNGNGRWTDELARRLLANKPTSNVGVLNEGIGGNRLLHDGLGPNALARLDRDALTQTGARWLIVLEGVYDIGACRETCDLESIASEIVGAYRQIIVRAHSQKTKVYGATITPFGRSFYASPGAERARQTVNQWIRTSGQFDAVIDFDAAARDPGNLSDLSAASDSGDHLHPNNAGYKTMANSIDLKLFR
jgi:lysophospholipase L1-like esterase